MWAASFLLLFSIARAANLQHLRQKVLGALEGKGSTTKDCSSCLVLDVAIGPGSNPFGPFFGLNVKIAGVTADPQQMMVDLGSSTMAFCDGPKLDRALDGYITSPPQGQCVRYGLGNEYWFGSVYKADIEFTSEGDSIAVGNGLEFATMAEHKMLTCGGDPEMPPSLAGIVGLGFSAGNTIVYPVPDPAQLFKSNADCMCYQQGCPDALTVKKDPDAFMDFLNEEGDQTFGLAWSGAVGTKEGKVYGGAEAMDPSKSPWDADKAIGPVQALPDAEDLLKIGNWQMNILGFSATVNGEEKYMNVSNYCVNGGPLPEGEPANENPRPAGQQCIMDTGNNQVSLPKYICVQLGLQNFDTKGNVTEVTESDVDLTIRIGDWTNPDKYVNLVVSANGFHGATSQKKSFYNCDDGTTAASIVLGFSFWKDYYTVFDDKKDQVYFVPKAAGTY